jgi:S-(hydroxymethyl)glutathione dehydrogenase / alcohol dehydrogenase
MGPIVKTTAAVLVELKQPLELADLEVPSLKPGQVLVEIRYSGVCHTQVLEARGYRGVDPYLPHCLGHEGSGVVRDVGLGVSKVKPGDLVILSWIKGSGADVPGTIYDWQGRKVNAGGITTFARHSVISENRLTVIPPSLGEGLPERLVPLLGCAVPTGVGAVVNTAQARPGQSLAVFGTGGVGLCAIAGAALAGCVPVIAVDMLAEKLVLAKRLGATHTINASTEDVVEVIRKIQPGGIDIAIEAAGKPVAVRQALACVRAQGGAIVVVGNARRGESVDLDPWELNQGKRILGTWGGDSMPDRDYLRYARLMQSGRLLLEPLLSRVYALTEINRVLNDLENGLVARPVVDMTQV